MKRRIVVFLLVVAAIFLPGCRNPFQQPETPENLSPGANRGRVIISIAGAEDSPAPEAAQAAAARTLLPELGAFDYKLEFTRDGETDPAVSANIIATTLTQELDPGSYTLSITAYKAGTNVPVAEGGVALEISAGQSVSVTVPLALCQAGTGYLDYTVGLPDGMTLTTGFLTLYPFSGNAAAMNIDLSAPGLSGVEEVPSGYYRIRLLIGGVTDSVSKTAAKTAVLHISNSLMTTALYTLGPDDFTDAELYIVENSTGLNNALNNISAAAGTVFTILIKGNFSSPPVSLTNTGYSGKTITLHGDNVVNEISLANQGSLFTIGAAASEPVLILQNITLKGVTGNNTALVKVDNGTLIMEDGSVITGNTNSSSASGLYSFTSTYGGGVYVGNGGTLTMRGSTSVSENTVSSSAYESYSYGGGVYIANGGLFTMQDSSSVSGNTASAAVDTGIANCRSYSYGGGVYVGNGGTLTMQDEALVSKNMSSAFTSSITPYSYSYGGGVYIADGGTLTMQNRTSVSENTVTATTAIRNAANNYSFAYSYGGGVYVARGTFTIQDNASVGKNGVYSSAEYEHRSYGGGVYVDASGVFTKQPGGIVYGLDAGNALENTVGSSANYGPAVFVNSSPAKIRYNTAGAGVTLDSAVSGAAGGWELLSPISNITYSSVSGGDWALEGDGRRRSPAIGHNTVTKARVSFISNTTDASITIQLDVSSEYGYDFAFISTLDNDSAAYNNGYYTGSRISGGQSVTVMIPVPIAGSHFVDIGYRKDGSESNRSDCAWFKVIQ